MELLEGGGAATGSTRTASRSIGPDVSSWAGTARSAGRLGPEPLERTRRAACKHAFPARSTGLGAARGKWGTARGHTAYTKHAGWPGVGAAGVQEFRFKFGGPLAFAQARVDSESAVRAARGPAWSLPTPRPSLPDSADLGSEPGGGGGFARAAAGVLGSRPAASSSAVGPERPGGGTEVKDSQKVSGGSD